MTELAVRPDNTPVHQSRPLVEWAHEARAAHDLASGLVDTPFCPDAFRGKPMHAAAAILAGSEVGLSPMAALNAYDVIQGRPAPKAITLRALVQSHGHDIWMESSTADRCIMRGQRRGSAKVQEVAWDMKRARDLKLTDKPNWKNQPQAMLVARATAEIARLIAADVILGIPYSAEELEDQQPAPVVAMSREDAPKRTVRRAATPPPAEVPEPDLDDAPVDLPTPPTETGEAITAPQLRKLHAVMGENGLGQRDEALAYLSRVVGREITTSKELTKVEASEVIDALEGASESWPEVAKPADAS